MMNSLVKVLRRLTCKLASSSTILYLILYLIFITFVVTITFPNNKKSTHKALENVDIDSSPEESEAGELNRVFHPEMRDGNFVEPQILNENSNPSQVLKFAFRKADANADGLLNIKELARYINLRIRDHIDTSIKRNPQLFAEVDKSPQDGLVSWNEYHSYFLKNLKLDESYIANHDEKKHVKLDRKAKEDLMRDKARWAEVLSSDPYSLTLDEFLHFMHPGERRI